MGWAMLAGQAVQTGMNLLGGDKDIDPGSAAGFKDSGWQDTSVVEPRQPTNTIVRSNPDSEGKMGQVLGGLKKATSGINKGLGNNIGKAASQLAGDAIGNAMQRRHSKKNFQRLRDEGLTPVEIAGSGGGTVQSQGNTLGSGPATQIKSQQDFTAGENQKNRDNAKDIANISARAPGRQAGVSEGKLQLERQLTPAKLAQLRASVAKMEIDTERAEFDLENFWPIRFSNMSMENGMMALAAFNQGIDFEAVLKSEGGTPGEIQDARDLLNLLVELKSKAGGIVGWMNLIDHLRRGEGAFGGTKMFKQQRPQEMPKEGPGSSRGNGATGSWNPGATGKF